MIKSVAISNFGPLGNISFDCKKFNLFQGKSHQGKSSILHAIKWCIVGGNDEFNVKNGEATTEVVLFSDNGSRIERRLTRGGTNKLYVYDSEGNSLKKPQDVLNSKYDSLFFSPTDMLRMSTKDLNEFISKTISKRLKLTDSQIKYYKIEHLNLKESEDPVKKIEEYYNKLYAERTEVNRIVKNLETKSAVTKNYTQEEVDELTKDLESLNVKLNQYKEKNMRIELSKKNKEIKIKTENNIKLIKEEIEKGKDLLDKMDQSINELSNLEKELKTLETETENQRNSYKAIENVLKKLESGEIQCPIDASIKCNTDMKPYVDDLKNKLETTKKNGKLNFDKTQKLKETVSTLKQDIETAKNIKSKQLELDRAESILKELEILDEDEVDCKTLENEIREKTEILSEMKVSLEINKSNSVDSNEYKIRQTKLNEDLDKLNTLLKNVIPNSLSLNVKNVTLGKEGLFFQGVPFGRLGDSFKLRLCTAVLKDLFPSVNIFTLDRMECIDSVELKKYVEHYASEENDIQYFGTLVGNLSFDKPTINCITMDGFNIKR